MNQKNGISKLRNVALATILAAGVVGPTYVATAESVSSTGSTATTATSTTTSSNNETVSSMLNSLTKSDSTASTTPTKEETVYVFSKADGSVKNTIVSDWLKNVKKDNRLQDVSNLTDIENTEGNQSYTTSASGSQLSWDANGSDIYYQGNTTQQAPVTVKVTYKLDGKDISPDDLAGKSGKVTIRFDYTNNSKTTATVNGATETIYTPFVAMTGLVLDNDCFTNVQVTNGKSMNDGDHTSIAGFALPGMQSNLGISKDKYDVPDYVEVTADTTGFKLATTLTVTSSNLLDNVDSDGINTSNVQDSIDKLSSSMTQLIDGSSSLYDGLQQLADGTNTLDSGVGELQDKTASLPDSSNQLAEGAAALAKGLVNAVSGTSQLQDGAIKVYDGLNEMKNGTDTTTGLKDAVNSLGDKSTSGTLLYGSNKLVQGLTLLRNGGTLPDGSTSVGLVGAQQGAANLASGLKDTTDFDNAITKLTEANTKAKGYAADASTDATSSSTKATAAAKILGALAQDTSIPAAQRAEIAKAYNDLASQDKTDPGAIYNATKASTEAGGASQYNDGAIAGLATLKNDTDTSLTTASAGAQQISDGLTTAINYIDNTTSPTFTLLYAAEQVDGGLNILKNGGTVGSKTSKGLVGAVDALGDKNTEGTLLYGAAQIAGGTDDLEAGLNSASDGANQIAGGTQQLADATPALVSGISALKSGSEQLASGTSTATDGSLQLSDGLKQFNDEGVQKIVDAYNGDLKGLSDRMKATVNAGKAYDTFSGKSDTMSGKVKFIYETDSIG